MLIIGYTLHIAHCTLYILHSKTHMFLQYSLLYTVLPSYNERMRNEIETGIKKEGKFDRDAMILLANSVQIQDLENITMNSPIRKSTFDLLQLLTLHEAIHRVLRQYKDDGYKKETQFKFLREFFATRIDTYFDGPGRYDRADDFVEELLLTVSPSVSVVQSSVTSGENSNILDPLAIITDILIVRSEICMEWKFIVDKTSEDHVDLRKSLLTQSWGEDHMISSKNDDVKGDDDKEMDAWQ